MMTSVRSHGQLPNARQLAQLARLAASLDRGLQRLVSGRRIAAAADDCAGLASARRLEAAVRSAAMGTRNLADGQDVARIVDGALQTSQDDLARMRELSVQAQNGTLSDADRAVIQQEYDQLAAQLDQTAAGTSFAGRALLDGSPPGVVVVRDGSGGAHVIDLPDARAAALGVAGRSVADPATVQALDAASASLAAARGRLGAADEALERHERQLGAAGMAAECARSRIEDVDVARAIAELTRDRLLFGLAVFGLRLSLHGRLDRIG